MATNSGSALAAALATLLLTASAATAAFHPRSLERPDLLQKRREIVRAYGAQRYIAHVKATMARPDRGHLLDGRKPTLWVAASHDAVLPAQALAQQASRVPGCRFVVVEDAGHPLPLEQPAALARLLGEWASQASSAGPRP